MVVALASRRCAGTTPQSSLIPAAVTIARHFAGYLLGDWSDQWEDFARKCVTGDWEQNGVNTFARRRPGITPETPVRNVETGKK